MGKSVKNVQEFLEERECFGCRGYNITEYFAINGESTYQLDSLMCEEEEGEAIFFDHNDKLIRNDNCVLRHFIVDDMINKPKIIGRVIYLKFSDGNIKIELL